MSYEYEEMMADYGQRVLDREVHLNPPSLEELAAARQADIDAGKRPMADWWYDPHDFQYNGYFDAEPQQMSDFKVGDVVTCTEPELVREYGPGQTYRIDHIARVGVRVQPMGITPAAFRWASPESLVSRLSDPLAATKPTFRKGDRVSVEGRAGTVTGSHDASGHWVRMDGDLNLGDVYFLGDSLKLITPPPPPALKPGDHVVTKHGCRGFVVGDSSVAGFRWRVEIRDNGSDADLVVPYITNLREHEVSLVPTQPALKVGDRVRMLQSKHAGTEGVIKGRNTTPHYEWEVKPDGADYTYGFNSNELALAPRPQTATRHNGDAERLETILKEAAQGRRYDSYERGPGIAAKIPLHNRRLPSRTLTWSNLGDEYDLLPDAD